MGNRTPHASKSSESPGLVTNADGSVPAFNRMLGESLNQLAAKVAVKGEHHEQYASQH